MFFSRCWSFTKLVFSSIYHWLDVIVSDRVVKGVAAGVAGLVATVIAIITTWHAMSPSAPATPTPAVSAAPPIKEPGATPAPAPKQPTDAPEPAPAAPQSPNATPSPMPEVTPPTSKFPMPQLDQPSTAQKQDEPWVPFYEGGKLKIHGIDIEWIMQITLDKSQSTVMLLLNGDKFPFKNGGRPANIVNPSGKNCVVQGKDIEDGNLKIKVDCFD
jgi:hypothetical protein